MGHSALYIRTRILHLNARALFCKTLVMVNLGLAEDREASRTARSRTEVAVGVD